MPYYVRTHKVWERLRKRFDLVIRQPTQEKEVSEFIQPISDADQLVRENKVIRNGIATTSATTVAAHTVIDGKRQLLKGVEIRNETGTATFTKLTFRDKSQSNWEIVLWEGTAQAPLQLPSDTMFHPFWMEPGDVLRVTIQATGTLAYCFIIVEEEDWGE